MPPHPTDDLRPATSCATIGGGWPRVDERATTRRVGGDLVSVTRGLCACVGLVAPLLLAVAFGCSGAPARAEPGPTPPPATAVLETPAATRYRVGDYVVYAYSGSALKGPLTLTEEIVAQDGLRLEIQVTAKRGSEERRWVQVVTDTPENRRNDKLDELYLVVDGKRERLANEGNADVYRLYEWIMPPIEGPLRDKAQARRKIDIAGRSYELICTTGRQTVGKQEAEVELWDGEAFLWTKARTTMRAVDGGEMLYQVVVQETGRR